MKFRAQVAIEITEDNLENLNKAIEGLRVYRKNINIMTIYSYPVHEGQNNDKEQSCSAKTGKGSEDMWF